MANLLTPAQVAARLGTTDRTVRRWCAEGLLHATKVARDWLIEPVALEGFEPPRRGRPRKAAEAAERTE